MVPALLEASSFSEDLVKSLLDSWNLTRSEMAPARVTLEEGGWGWGRVSAEGHGAAGAAASSQVCGSSLHN